VCVVNIEEPVELYQLVPAGTPGWPEARMQYEGALSLYERKEFGAAVQRLGNWHALHSDDEPAMVLLHRTVHALVEGLSPTHPTWVLAEK
jgi:hypothetical protein